LIPLIVKKDGTRELFDAQKIRTGILRACAKRPVTSESIDRTVDRVCRYLNECNRREIASEEVGNLILAELKKLDDIAFVRFASVYREFSDVSQFIELLKERSLVSDDDTSVEGFSEA
jgi:transcriptional repressor NrdR